MGKERGKEAKLEVGWRAEHVGAQFFLCSVACVWRWEGRGGSEGWPKISDRGMARRKEGERDGTGGGGVGVDEWCLVGFSFVCVEEAGKKKGTSGSGGDGGVWCYLFFKLLYNSCCIKFINQ